VRNEYQEHERAPAAPRSPNRLEITLLSSFSFPHFFSLFFFFCFVFFVFFFVLPSFVCKSFPSSP